MLTVDNLTKRYATQTIFDGISFEVPDASFVSLTGKNGIGKTTLLNILGGSDPLSR
ncbi:ABC-2 type transport system ATP-binding protein/putative spermidine/putrescine transport system ATP-binding protein/putative hydroxymethylpyrimidine transport system ATP-binding protein [Lentibacillus persicus]|uniref:ABC-2 type transport system ATP-binding protein/putative spermidine/putrescine transport system ATP-binding protein/putative hydroxymethylpyrimidine transport system ATP-binding protein n=1 Tax=Lentibacillus persicus TaxID=640948 RepID=A0A1I1XCK7_9BACI|nr:ATP-binding cassette domain-containing protein [Lentibacillus persicus]SFE03100.1 ABC-2 type transport system ATP-binding protein/putative spermidine/putrescine transport system ATP-binding protein/putative hydroxymethylpyrimidine transport system ATP-binding protein [Lentibacillus persicus]